MRSRFLLASSAACACLANALVSCGSEDSGALGPTIPADAAGDSAAEAASPADSGTADTADSTLPKEAGPPADVTIPPSGSGGPRLFVPRIVPEDSSQKIWNAKQRSAILWFGRVDTRNNHVDVRAGYGDSFLMIHCAVFDRQIYDEAQDDQLDQWDSLRLLLDTEGSNSKTQVDKNSWRIDAQAHRQGTQKSVVYRGDAGSWVAQTLPLGNTAEESPTQIIIAKGYRGEDRDKSRGWHVTFYVPWSVLGLSGPPAQPNSVWRVGLSGFDRDSLEGSLKGDPQHWPSAQLKDSDPSTWGSWELLSGHFLSWDESGAAKGQPRPSYAIAASASQYKPGTETKVVIRAGQDGALIENTSVGASAVLCSGDDDYNFGDGENSWGGHTQTKFFHIQNQEDYADWPCFAKILLKFPLAKLPNDKVVVSARLLLHHKEPTSGGNEGERSLLQAFSVGSTLRSQNTAWTASNVSWNEAPLAIENLAGCWGDRTGNMETGWDKLPEWQWDVTRAVAAAAGTADVSFALYSADSEYHTGKQFVTSADFPDWGDPAQRPSLEITYADK